MIPIAYIYTKKTLSWDIRKLLQYLIKSITFYHENINYMISFQKEKYG